MIVERRGCDPGAQLIDALRKPLHGGDCRILCLKAAGVGTELFSQVTAQLDTLLIGFEVELNPHSHTGERGANDHGNNEALSVEKHADMELRTGHQR
jgi:hypothetical protein